MTLRRTFLSFGSILLGLFLLVGLIKVGQINIQLTLLQLKSVSIFAFVKLVLLNGLLVYLSAEKWRCIDGVLRHSCDSVPSRITSYAITSTGMALGLVLPVQLGMATARTLGTHSHGGMLKRGTVGTLLEQGFDILIVILMGIASVATWFYGGGWTVWIFSAAIVVILALLVMGPFLRVVQRLTVSYCARWIPARNRTLQKWSEAKQLAHLHAGLARRLLILSAVRFCIVIFMAGQTATMVRLRIPLWHMAAAMPFVVISTVIALTPGGIGVNELTSTTVLKLFGTPISVAAQWSLANRLLVVGSCLAVWTCTVLLQAFESAVASNAGRHASDSAAGELRRC